MKRTLLLELQDKILLNEDQIDHEWYSAENPANEKLHKLQMETIQALSVEKNSSIENKSERINFRNEVKIFQKKIKIIICQP